MGWLGVGNPKGAFLLDPDDVKSQQGERLIILVACCEALVLLSACLFGLWVYLRSA
jgi:hypothetical protein